MLTLTKEDIDILMKRSIPLEDAIYTHRGNDDVDHISIAIQFFSGSLTEGTPVSAKQIFAIDPVTGTLLVAKPRSAARRLF